MADKDIQLGIGLDTSDAESSLKGLETSIPKSLDKMIKKFEKLGTKMETAGGSTAKAAEKITKQNQALKDSFQEVAKEAESSIKSLSRSIKSIDSKAFKSINKDLKDQTRSFLEMNKVLGGLEKKILSAFSDKNFRLNPSGIKNFVDKANKIAKDLNIDFKLDSNKIAKNINEQRKHLFDLLEKQKFKEADRYAKKIQKELAGIFSIDNASVSKEAKELASVLRKAIRKLRKL